MLLTPCPRRNAKANPTFYKERYAMSSETRTAVLSILFVYKKEIPTCHFKRRKDKTVSRQLGLRWRLDQIPSNRHGRASSFLNRTIDEASPAKSPV